MKPKSLMMINLLLNRFHSEGREALLKYLPEDEREQLNQHPVSTQKVSRLLIHPELFIKKIDPTWLVSLFKKEPKSIQNLFLNVLDEWQQKKLAKALSISFKNLNVPQRIQTVILKIIHKKFIEQDILPIAFLPDSDFSFLLEMSKQELVLLIDYLGMYDLAKEFRRSIDQKSLNAVYRMLSADKKSFLNQLVKKKVKVEAPSIQLHKLNGNQVNLNQLLQKRGLNRLGAALSGEHPSFLWYFTHMLDRPRTEVIQSSIVAEDKVAEVVSQFQHQINYALNFMKEGTT